MWFNEKDIVKYDTINVDDLHGYVLPHAGTSHTGDIIGHTLRFKPVKKFEKIIILYYPAFKKKNINTKYKKYYHEYYVVMKSLDYVIKNFWKIDTKFKFVPINLKYLKNPKKSKKKFKNLKKKTLKPNKYSFIINELNKYNSKKDLIVVSADFSHFLEFQEAIKKENKAAHGLMFRNKINKNLSVVDDMISFNKLYSIIPKDYILQWVGRTRSMGYKGVGYLSFLIRQKANPQLNKPDGIFITSYDKELNARECLGNWFNINNPYTKFEETKLKNKVLDLSGKTSRLTSGKFLEIPIKYYTITYLYKDNYNKFIRGWHGIKYNAFYLPNVFLENTFNNGDWINSSDVLWKKDNEFNLSETLHKLNNKAGIFYNDNNKKNYELYYSHQKHIIIKKRKSKKLY